MAEPARILMVEDDTLLGALIEDVLALDGYDVVWSTSGPDALRAAAEVRPDAILLDLMLPDVDGWTVLRELKGNPRTARAPVVIVSAVVERSTAAERSLAHAIVKKPFAIDELRDAVRDAVAWRQDAEMEPLP